MNCIGHQESLIQIKPDSQWFARMFTCFALAGNYLGWEYFTFVYLYFFDFRMLTLLNLTSFIMQFTD